MSENPSPIISVQFADMFSLQTFSLALIGVCLSVPGNCNDARGNVSEIILQDAQTFGDYSDSDDKEIVFKSDGEDTKALVKKKKLLFSKDFKLEECENGKCTTSNLDKKVKNKLEGCTYEGKLENDPNSTVSMTNCDGVMQMTFMSSIANLSSNTFRQEGDKLYQNEGKIMKDKTAKKKGVNEALAEDSATKLKNGTGFVDKDGAFLEFEQTDSRDYADDKCCRLKKKKCKKAPEGQMSCKVSYSENKCGPECEQMKSVVAKNAKKVISNIEKKSKQKIKDESAEGTKKETTTEATKTTAEATKTTTEATKTTTEATKTTTEATETTPKASETTEASESTEGSDPKEANDSKKVPDDDEVDELFADSEESTEEEPEKKEAGGGEGEDEKSKDLRDLVTDELIKLNLEAETSERRESPKEEPSMFRSKSVRMICPGGCVEKAPNPTKKVYTERTIELGICVDKYLWEVMKTQIAGSEEDTKVAMLDMIHSLVVNTETLFQHPTISSQGGFKLAINGINIWKDDSDPLVKSVHDASDQIQQLTAFSEYARQKNERYDGYRRSYDMNILLSGTHDKYNIGGDAGVAYISTVCTVECAGLTTVTLRDGRHLDNMPALLAHEMGHIIGANHDGDQSGINPKNPNTYNVPGSCPEHMFIMTPSQSGTIVEWSECSREEIDYEYERRETENPKSGNCFYT